MSKSIFLLIFLLCANLLSAQEIKNAQVAGAFYPEKKEVLEKQIQEFFQKADSPKISAEIFALICPHAGYAYSGQVASYAYKNIQGNDYDLVVILAPSHYYNFFGFAIWPKGSFSTPLGSVAVDEETCQKLLALIPYLKENKEVFYEEHALEVELPFLQYALKNFKIVPIIFGRFTLSDCELLAQALSVVLKDKKALIVASSDMSHYHTYPEAKEMDNLALDYILKNDPQGLYTAAKNNQIQLCGLGPVLSALYYAKEKQAKIQLLKYANSGDVTGDFQRVVGYAALAVFKEGNQKGEENMLSKENRKRLLEIARLAIEDYLKTEKKLPVKEEAPELNKKQGAFVTLHKQGELRGCIGNLIGTQPLYLTVRDMAIQAAVADPRFLPLELAELKDIEIEISVLSELEKIDNPDLIELGKHGVLIRKGLRSGVFLPQVATETGWSKEEFLNNLCAHKAGLSPDCWRDGSAEIYIFSAEVFNEKDY